MHRKHWLTIFFIAVLAGCNKEYSDIETFLGFEKPAGFPEPAYHFSTNQVTKGGFELGRKLFYDAILSANNTISCGSCHIQTSSFTQHGHRVSHGIFDRLGNRNSQPIMNLAWNTSFMWDGGVADLDLQPIVPITSHEEMGDSVSNVLERLRATATYPALFKKAFGTEEINSARFLKALSQFMVMCVSSNSKYDQVKRSQAVFTEQEARGYSLFQQKCGTCHQEPLFTDHSFRNNGLSASMVNDKGRYNITLDPSDEYKFKVPSLRNIEFTPPYMHDGRLLTIESVLDHYSGQVQQTPNLDPALQQNALPGIELSTDEKENIIVFLKTLSDREFLTDKRFSEQ